MNFSEAYRLRSHAGCTFHFLHRHKGRMALQHPHNPAWRWTGIGRKPRWLLAWENEYGSWEGIALVPLKTNAGGNAPTESTASGPDGKHRSIGGRCLQLSMT